MTITRVCRCCWMFVTFVLLSAPGLALAAGSEPSENPSPITESASRPIGGYLQPYLGWGSPILTADSNEASWYKTSAGLAVGVKLSKLTLGLDFNYYFGTKLTDATVVGPDTHGDGRVNAMRLAANVGYDLPLPWLVVRPHVLGGIEWRRASIGDFSSVKRGAFWAPAVLALFPLRKDGRFNIGLDARWGMVLFDSTVYTQISGFLAFEAQF